MSGRHVLLAVGSQSQGRLERILAGHQLFRVGSEAECRALAASRQFSLIVLGVLFGHGHMFELLRFVRVQQVNRTTPVVCLLEAREGFAPVALDGMDQGSKALAANAFMDLEKYPDDDRGNGRLRTIIDLLIDIDGELHAGFDAVDD